MKEDTQNFRKITDSCDKARIIRETQWKAFKWFDGLYMAADDWEDPRKLCVLPSEKVEKVNGKLHFDRWDAEYYRRQYTYSPKK